MNQMNLKMLVAIGLVPHAIACSSGSIGGHAGAGGSSTGLAGSTGAAGTTGVAGTTGTGNTGGIAPTSDLCQGLVTDKVAHPMPAMAKPALMAPFTDPAFHTNMRRITNVGTGVIKPLYSPTQAWNADETYLMLYEVGGGHRIYNGKTYAFIKGVDISPADIEQVYWDTTNPDLFYYVEGRNLMRYRVATDRAEIYHTLTNCQSGAAADSHAWMSWDSKFLGLQCDGGGATFIYQMDTGMVLGSTTANPDRGPPSMGASGTLARWDLEVVDARMNVLREIDVPVAEHSSLGRLANGHDTYNGVVFDEGPRGSGVGSLVVHDMTNGTGRVVIGPDTGYPYPPTGTHVSAPIYKNPGWVFISVVGDTDGQGILDQELVLANTNVTGVVCRIGHHRSHGKEGQNDYWGEPHVTGSPTGTRAVFASDWGGGASVDTYVVELPSYRP